MKLITDNGELILSKDFALEMEVNHPFFSDEGSSSIPITLPATPYNLRVLGWPDCPSQNTLFRRIVPCTLVLGAYHKEGALAIESVEHKEGISCAFLIEDSSLWGKFGSTKLRELVTGTLYGNQAYLNAVASGMLTDSFDIFPVFTESDGFDNATLNPAGPSGLLWNSKSVTLENRDTMIYPAGYGNTVFLRLHYVIRVVVEACGYKLVSNPFSKSPWKHIVLLNSCADGLCKLIDGEEALISSFLPDVTVGEFFGWMKARFGAYLVISGNEANISLLDDTLRLSPDLDITSFLRQDDLIVTHPEPQRVCISCRTSLEGAKPAFAVAPESDDDGRVYVFDCSTHFDDVVEAPNILYYNRKTGQFAGHRNGELNVIGSNAFCYHRDGVSCNNIEAADEFVPMLLRDQSLRPFVGPREHLHTYIRGKEETSQGKLMLCWDGGTFQRSCYFTFRSRSNTDAPALTPEGLAPYFWYYYNQILSSGAPEIIAQIDWPEHLLMSGSIFSPFILNNQKVLLKSLTYSIVDGRVECGQSVLLCIPPDDHSEQEIKYWCYTWDDRVRETYDENIDAAIGRIVSEYGVFPEDFSNVIYPKKDPIATKPSYPPITASSTGNTTARTGSLYVFFKDSTGAETQVHRQVTWQEWYQAGPSKEVVL